MRANNNIEFIVVKTFFGLQHYTYGKLQSPACSATPAKNNFLAYVDILLVSRTGGHIMTRCTSIVLELTTACHRLR